MHDRRIEEWIARELGRMEKPENLIARVCTETGLKWDAAEELILYVQQTRASEIHRGRRFMAISIGVPVVASGLIALVASTLGIVTNSVVIRGTNITHPSLFWVFGVSLAMVGGGLYGMLRVKK